MSQKNLILIGGGGHCKSVIDVAESAGYNIIGILDMPEDIGKSVLDYKVIGTDDDIPKFADKAEFIITVGFIKSPAIRMRLYDKIREAGGKLATIVASTAHVSRYASLGEGTVVMHQTVVNAGAKIGENCIINTFCNIEHDAVIGDQCHISTGTMVNGDCKVAKMCFIGSQSVLANGISICDDVIVGAESFVIKNLSEHGIHVGNPYKLLIINELKMRGGKIGYSLRTIRQYNLSSYLAA